MSEPSPEAKQAAEAILRGRAINDNRTALERTEQIVQRYLDTATAKAREVEVRMTEEMRHMNDLWARLHALLKTGKDSNWDEEPFAKIVKLLDELKQHQTEYDRLSAIIEKDTLRIVELEEQLAHQQPSAIRRNPNEDHRAAQPSDEDIKRDPKLAREFVKSLGLEVVEQLSASTADVEIAPGRWHYRDNEAGDYAIYGETNKWFVIVPTYVQAVCIVEGHNRALVQARASLVEAGKQAIPRLERCMCAGSNGHRLNLKIAKTLAALTGTGEKV